MKKTIIVLVSVFIIACFGLVPHTHAQTLPGGMQQIAPKSGPNSWDTEPALLSLPDDYTTTTKSYPLLIFLHGSGEASSTPNLSLIYTNSVAGGPSYFIANGQWPSSFTNPADGQPYKFIVVSPQATWWSTSATTLNYIIPWLVSNYRVDTSRIYITGLSAGGQGVVGYASHQDVFSGAALTPTYDAAASIPMSAAIDKETTAQLQTLVNNTIAANVNTWGFGSESDTLGIATHVYVSGAYGSNPGPTPPGLGSLGRYTDFTPLGGHCCWNTFYNPAYTESVNGTTMNIYQWLLQFKRSGTVTPPPAPANIPPTANAGPGQTITLPTSSVTLSGSGTDTDGTIASYAWTNTVKPTGAATPTISIATSASTAVSGLTTAGSYTFRLTVTDNLGATGYSDVTITVNAAPASGGTTGTSAPYGGTARAIPGTIQAEDFDTGGEGVAYHDTDTANQGGQYRPSEGVDIEAKTGGGYDVGWTAAGEWMKYTVNIAAAGTYTLQVVAASPYAPATATFDVDGTIIGTVTVPVTGGFQTWQTINAGTVTLPAGTHVLRIYENAANVNFDSYTFSSSTTTNTPPTANAGTAQTITLPTSTATLTGGGTDANGTITGYAWTKVSGTGGTITSPTSATTTVTGLTAGTYTYQLTVTDNNGATGTSTVTITVLPAPVITPSAQTTTYSIDFGASGSTTTTTGWNNITNPSVTGTATTLVDSTGATSSRQIKITDAFYYNAGLTTDSSTNTNGTTASSLFPANATKDSFFLGTLNGITDTSAVITVTGLSNTNTYDFRFYASRVAGDGANRTTDYTIGTTTVTLNATDNINNYIDITGVTPTNGTITITVAKDAAAVYGYLGVLQITEHGTVVNTPPAPSTPVANAGTAQIITLPTNSVTLTGSGTDTGGTITSYAWSKVLGGTATIAAPTSASTGVSGLAQGTYTFRLTVTDNLGATATSDVAVTVNAQPPAGTSVEIPIDASTMVINENVVGDETKLFNEQNTLQVDASGNPVASATNPVYCPDVWTETKGHITCWSILDNNGVKEISWPAHITIDLKATYNVTDAYVYMESASANGTNDALEIRASDDPFNFVNKVGGSKLVGTYPYNQWIRVPLTTNNNRYLQLTITPDIGKVGEIVFYGTKTGPTVADSTPTGSSQQQHYPFDTFAGTNVSYGMGDGYDKDYDYQWGTLRNYAGFRWTFDANDNYVPNAYQTQTELRRIASGSGVKSYSVEMGTALSMIDPADPNYSNGGDAFTDRKPIDYTLCKGTVAVNNVPSCLGVATNPASYAHKAYLDKQVAIQQGSTSQFKQEFVELGNEPDGSWNQAGYFNPYELAAMMSADYDGHCNTIQYNGQSVGIKNGDPNMKVLMPGLVSMGSGDMRYLNAMNFWWQHNRPCAQKIPADVINFHFYSSSSGAQGTNTGYGISPEDYGMRQMMKKTVDFRNKYAPSADVAVTEFGYDSYPQVFPNPAITWCQNAVYGNSIIAARPIGSADSDEVAGEWISRSYLEMAAAGIDFADQFWLADEYKLNTVCGTFAASGLLKQLVDAINWRPVYTPRPGWYYVQTLRTQLKGMKYESDKDVNGVRIMKFRGISNPSQVAYAVWSPTSNGYMTSSYPVSFDRTGTTQVVELVPTTETGQIDQTINNAIASVMIPVSERPTIVRVNEDNTPFSGGTTTSGTIVVNAGATQTITLPTNSVTLTGTATDTAGTITGYTWTPISGVGGAIATPAAASTVVSGLTEGTYIYRLTVTDTTGATAYGDVMVVVNPSPNNPPTANAGPDQTITFPTTTATLVGSGTDTDGTIASYAWSKVSGGTATITSPTLASTTVTGLAQGTYVFMLTVTDNLGATGSDTVTITVVKANSSGGGGGGSSGGGGGHIKGNVKTTATATTSAYAGSDVTIALPITSVVLVGSATDTVGPVTYTWSKISGPGGTIDYPNRQITTARGLAKGNYIFQLTVTNTDGTAVSDTVNVTVDAAGTSPQLLSPANSTADILGAATATAHVTTKASKLNVRSSPVTGPVVSQVPAGSTGTLLNSQNGWLQVSFDSGVTGWVSGAYADVTAATGTPTQTVAPAATGSTARVTAASLNVRSAPVTGTIISKATLGTAVSILNKNGGWSQIRLPSGITGWVSNAYLSFSSATATIPTTAPVAQQLGTGPIPASGPATIKPLSSTGFVAGDYVRVRAASLNVRSAPNGSLIGKAQFGATGTVITTSGTWAKVLFNGGLNGYVSTAYLSR